MQIYEWFRQEFLPFTKLELHSLYKLKVFFQCIVSQLNYVSLYIFKGILHFCSLIIISYGPFTTPSHEQAEYTGERTASILLTHMELQFHKKFEPHYFNPWRKINLTMLNILNILLFVQILMSLIHIMICFHNPKMNIYITSHSLYI